jgi:hypothetical protein
MSDYLLNNIVSITKDEKSLNFWKKAIKTLGENIVEAELGELKYQIHQGKIKYPAKYLTTLLKKQMFLTKKRTKKERPANEKEIEKTYLNPNQLDLFRELKPVRIEKGELKKEKQMDVPYSEKHIPWATFIGPDFFTLSTNKAKNDKVMAKFRTLDGQVCLVPLLRGAFFPGDKGSGILTAEHGRVLGGLESIWVKQGQHNTETEKGAVNCYCHVKIRELAKILGWKSFGGRDLNHLKKLVVDLKRIPYYLNLESIEEFKIAGLKGYGFFLLGDTTLVEKKNGREETIIRVEFSDTYSRQILARRVVKRPKELITTRSEIAFLLHLYLEPILIKNGYFAKELRFVVKDLNLPQAKWHNLKYDRKRQFEKAIKELKNKQTGTGQRMDVEITKGLVDYMLEAKLIGQQIIDDRKEE